jgi:hypothetical protein
MPLFPKIYKIFCSMRYVCHPHLNHPPEKIKLLGVSHSFANYSTFYVEIYKRIKSVCFNVPKTKLMWWQKLYLGSLKKPIHFTITYQSTRNFFGSQCGTKVGKWKRRQVTHLRRSAIFHNDRQNNFARFLLRRLPRPQDAGTPSF